MGGSGSVFTGLWLPLPSTSLINVDPSDLSVFELCRKCLEDGSGVDLRPKP